MRAMSKQKQLLRIALFVVAIVCGAYVTKALADQDYLPTGASANASRACSFEGKTAQTVSVTSASAATSSATGVGVVRIVCTQNAHMVQGASGASPTATTSATFLPQLSPEYFLSGGGKFAFIRSSADGVCYVTDCK
jgi:hypothetical protein